MLNFKWKLFIICPFWQKIYSKFRIFCHQTSNWTINNNFNSRKPKIKLQFFYFFHKNVGIIRHCVPAWAPLNSLVRGHSNYTWHSRERGGRFNKMSPELFLSLILKVVRKCQKVSLIIWMAPNCLLQPCIKTSTDSDGSVFLTAE